MVELVLTDAQKKEIINQMKNSTLNTSVSLQIKDDNKNQIFVGAIKTEEGILVSGTRDDSGKGYAIKPHEITTLSTQKGGRRRRVRKTQRRKSTKRRHTRRYRRK
jgi:hypothetical protein